MTTHIGLDPSTKFGFGEIACNPSPMIISTALITAPAKLDGMARVLYLTDAVMELMPRAGSCTVTIEGYSFASVNGLLYVVEIGTMLRYQLLKGGYTIKLCPPNVLKKFVTGKGNADKKRVILDAHKRWGFDLSDDNQNDAACLGVIGAANHHDYTCPTLDMADCAKKLTVCS